MIKKFNYLFIILVIVLLLPSIVKASGSGPATKIEITFKTPVEKVPESLKTVDLNATDSYNLQKKLYFQELKWYKYDEEQNKYVQIDDLSEKFNKQYKYAISVSYLITQEASPWKCTYSWCTETEYNKYYGGLQLIVNGKELDPYDTNVYTNGMENKTISNWKNPENGYVGYLIDTVFYELNENEMVFEEAKEIPNEEPEETPVKELEGNPVKSKDIPTKANIKIIIITGVGVSAVAASAGAIILKRKK